MSRFRHTVVLSFLLLQWAASARGAEFLARSAAEITAAQSSAGPGDVIVMANGVWTDQVITFSDNGSAAAPITLRAQTPGRVILTGSSRLTISGDHTITTGLTFRDGALTGGQVVSLTSAASNSRFTNNAIIDYDPSVRETDYEWVRVDGVQNRVDHNFFKGKNHAGITLEVFPSVNSQHRIDHNHFADRPRGNANGWETIRIGLSGIQTRSAKATVEDNLFERTDGELEIISNKTSDNVIRNNTFRGANGTLTLRHGKGALVAGNWFLGENRAGTGGVRVIGPDHVVVNNHMQDLDSNALSITTGYSDWDVATTATGYEPVYNVLIAHNTMVNVTDQIVTRDAGYTSDPTSTRNVRPRDVTMANNILWSTHETLVQGTEGANWTWAGNIAFGTTIGKSGSGIINASPQMVKDAYGVWRPIATSPAVNAAAAGAWAQPTVDVDGQPRTGPPDIGADERSTSPSTNRPLYGSDVGPDWLTRRTLQTGLAMIPVLVVEAEEFTAVRDPNNNGQTWQTIASPLTSGGAFIRAPGGARTDVPAQAHDAVVEFDVAFHDPGTYWLYVLARGPGSAANSLYSPATLGAEPTLNETIPENGQWTWVEIASYTIAADDVNRPITLQLGRREGLVEIDRLLFSPVQLNLQVPEPSGIGVISLSLLMVMRRRFRT